MCGRFALNVDVTRLKDDFPWIEFPEDIGSSFNIAPTQQVLTVTNESKPGIEMLHWGLVPFWAKDTSIANTLINARGETIAEKPSFKHAFKRRRCIIIASGYYEWQKTADGKQPVFIHFKDASHFAFAGLWEKWKDKSDPAAEVLRSCTIITIAANEALKSYHHRMPVILKPDEIDRWLTPGEINPEELQELIRPYPGDDFEVYKVSKAVNSPRNNDADLIKPATLF